MTNRELAERLERVADLLEIKAESPFRVRAYRRAAESVRRLNEPVASLLQAGTLTAVPGIGPGIAAGVIELVETGSFRAFDDLLDEIPATLLTLLDIPGVGPKTVGRLYRELGITDLVQLERALEAGRVRELKGFGPRQEQRMLEGIAFVRGRTNRVSIGNALPEGEALVAALADALHLPVSLAGSVRRMRETVGNIDVVAATPELDTIAACLSRIPGVAEIGRDGNAQACWVSARLGDGTAVRLVGTEESAFGTELLRWTGSVRHVAALRERAAGDLPRGGDEASVYAALGLDWVPPELREGHDEITLAASHRLPALPSTHDLKGDLHLHSVWSDGHASIHDLAMAARDRGYHYLAIADHSAGLRIANGLDVERLRRQREEIDRVNADVPEIRLLQAAEVEVHLDGSLDFPDSVLAGLDLVVASLHLGSRQSPADRTARLLRVLENPHVDIVAHPTGRIIDRRPPVPCDWKRVFAVAAASGTALEINANPARLDLPEELVREAAGAGVRFTIDSDAHDLASLDMLRYGVGVARRAGISPDSILNTRDVPGLLAWLAR